jgi:hypothetical protein
MPTFEEFPADAVALVLNVRCRRRQVDAVSIGVGCDGRSAPGAVPL